MQRWKSGAITTAELPSAAVECRIDELKNELAADHFCLRSFFATESAFLAVLFSFNLLSEFQRAIDPALKTYKQPATLRFDVFTCGAILGRSGHHLILHMSKNWGGYSQRKPLFDNLLHWPPPTSPKFNPPNRKCRMIFGSISESRINRPTCP
jgi:hypothetical protein